MSKELATSVEFIELFLAGSTGTTISGMLTKGQNIENCVPFVSHYCANNDHDGQFIDVWFTDIGGPSIHIERQAARSSDLYAKIYVVEFDPAKVKVYQGAIPTYIASDVDTTATISGAFDQSRSAMVFYYRVANSDYSDRLNWFMVRGQVDSGGTTVSFKKAFNDTNQIHTGHYYLFESIDEDFTVHHKTSSFGADTSYETGVYDWHNSFLIHSYYTVYNGTGVVYQTSRAYLWGNSKVAMNRSDTGYSCYYNIQKIEFSNDATASGVRYCPKITSYHSISSSANSRDISFESNHIQPSDTLSMIVAQNPSRVDSTTSNGSCYCAVWLTDDSHYRIERALSGSYYYPTYYLVDWNGQDPQYVDTGESPFPTTSGTSCVKSVENINTTIYEHVAVVHLSKGQDVSNCIVFKSGHATNTSNYSEQYRSEILTYFRGNELYLERGNENWECPTFTSVVEFWPDQVRVQQGEFIIGMNETATTVTLEHPLTSINKAFLVFGHFFGDSEAGWGYHLCRGRISSTTTLYFERGIAHSYPIMGYYYIAEDLGENWVVDHWNSSLAGTSRYNVLSTYNYNVYNTFNLISCSSNTNISAAYYSCWRAYYHSTFAPFVAEKPSNSYSSLVGVQSVRFLDDNRVRVNYTTQGLTGTTSEFTYSPSTSFSGSLVTAVASSLNGTARVSSNSSDYNTLAYWHVSYDEVTNTVTAGRNNASYSADTYHTIYVVDWVGYIPSIDISYNSLGYFVKTIEKKTYSAQTRRELFWPSKGQSLKNCLPLMTYWIGDDSGTDIEKFMFKVSTFGEAGGYIALEAFWAPVNGGIDIELTLIEFDPEQVRVQHGVCYLMAGTANTTVTIGEVVTSKTFMIHYMMPSDTVTSYFGAATVAGKINSSTQLYFDRANTTGDVSISWYVVECLQDQWSTQQGETLNTANTYYFFNCSDMPEHGGISWMSYNHAVTSTTPSYSFFRTYPDYDQRGLYQIVASRYTASSAINRMVFQTIEFNENLGLYVGHVHMYLGSTSNTATVYLGRSYDINRTVFWPGQALSTGMATTTSTSDGVQRAFAKFEFQDDHTLLITRYADSNSSEGWWHVYLIEFPLPSHEVSGVVREKGAFVSRKINLHRTDTGELLGTTNSNVVDGTYTFNTTYSGSTYVVCFDDVSGAVYNGLIETDVIPSPIVDSFPIVDGWYDD